MECHMSWILQKVNWGPKVKGQGYIYVQAILSCNTIEPRDIILRLQI